MELLDGQNAAAALAAGPPHRRRYGVGRASRTSPCRAHALKLVHCDLKPENLFLTRNGTLKVLIWAGEARIDAGRPAISTPSRLNPHAARDSRLHGTRMLRG